MTEDIKIIDDAIRRVPDFPKPGILFYDITGILVQPKAFKFVLDRMFAIYKDSDIDAIAAVESRGFIFASSLAEHMGVPLILIRKKGKLPGDTFSAKYALEYGEAEIEVHKADIKHGQKVLVIDDLIATGGTLAATKKLIEMGGGTVTDFFGVIGLPDLNYEKVLAPSKITTLINYAGD